MANARMPAGLDSGLCRAEKMEKEHSMRKTELSKSFAWVLIFSMILTACGNGNAGNSDAPATEGAKITSGGLTCPEPTPRVEVASSELKILVRTEYVPREVLDCFEMVYGIDLVIEEYSSQDEMRAGLSADGSKYDLALAADYMVSRLAGEGLLVELDQARLTNLGNLDAAWMNKEFDPGNLYSLPYLAGTDAIVVNTKTISNPPTSWADLWKPEYGGKLVFPDEARLVIGITLLSLGYDPNTTDAGQLEEARVKLAALTPNIQVFDSDSPKTALVAGGVDLGVTWTGEAFLSNQGNPKIEYVYPQEGTIFWQDNWVIPRDAANSDAVYAWLNYLLQDDVFWVVLRDFPYASPNRAALAYTEINFPEVYSAYAASPIIHPPFNVAANGYTLQDVGEAASLYEAIWDEIRGQ